MLYMPILRETEFCLVGTIVGSQCNIDCLPMAEIQARRSPKRLLSLDNPWLTPENALC